MDTGARLLMTVKPAKEPIASHMLEARRARAAALHTLAAATVGRARRNRANLALTSPLGSLSQATIWNHLRSAARRPPHRRGFMVLVSNNGFGGRRMRSSDSSIMGNIIRDSVYYMEIEGGAGLDYHMPTKGVSGVGRAIHIGVMMVKLPKGPVVVRGSIAEPRMTGGEPVAKRALLVTNVAMPSSLPRRVFLATMGALLDRGGGTIARRASSSRSMPNRAPRRTARRTPP